MASAKTMLHRGIDTEHYASSGVRKEICIAGSLTRRLLIAGFALPRRGGADSIGPPSTANASWR